MNDVTIRGKGNGPRSFISAPNIDREIGELASSVERKGNPPKDAHPALVACAKAAEMVRGVHAAHTAEGETLAQHLESIGEAFLQQCKEAAATVREQRVLPAEMAEKMADDLMRIGEMEAQRQAKVASGLTAARDALLGIDQPTN